MPTRVTGASLRQSKLFRYLGCAVFLGLLPCWLFSPSVQAQGECPELTSFYSSGEQDWSQTRSRLGEIFEFCLLSSEYFALYGAAQLNTGDLNAAMESLERSLLLDPNNGAALIDYAQALLQDGQLFAAIEANQLLLARQDIAAPLANDIAQRQRDWQSLTRQTIWQIDVLGGYDDNLNGAPDQDLVTLTLSGESVILALTEEFQVVSGPFLNLRVAGRHRRLGPQNQHNFVGELRGRLSNDSRSDLVQLSSRYNLVRPDRRNSWQLNAGMSHLLIGGSPLFTGTDASFRYQFASLVGCRPYYGTAVQHQVYRNQSQLNGLEAKVGVGSNCSVFGAGNQRLNGEISLLHNRALKSNRLGGSRDGWQFILDWQLALSRGVLSAQFNHTELLDERGFSRLLANNARRNIERNSLLIQYREALPALGPGAQLMVNFYFQDQSSNLDLFRTEDTSLEIGVSWRF